MSRESLRLSNVSVFMKKVTEATQMMQSGIGIIVNKNYYRSKGIERFFFGKSAVGLFPETDMWTRDHFSSWRTVTGIQA